MTANETVGAVIAAPLSAELQLEAALHKHERTSERLARFARDAERMESRLREAERDARRWRKYRDGSDPLNDVLRIDCHGLTNDDLDAAIDRAMGGEGG